MWRRPSKHAILSLIRRRFYGLGRALFYKGSYGLNGLDISLIDIIMPCHGSGYYVELGANDGLRQSNTFLLQQLYRWKGLLIEPSPDKFVECVSNRSFGVNPDFQCAACVDVSYASPFVEMEYSDLMSVAQGLNLKRAEVMLHADKGSRFLPNPAMRHSFGAVARTLTSLLEEARAPSDLDLLSLDVEGNELSVLRGLNFACFRPRWILAECRDNSVPDYLFGNGYQLERVLSDSGAYRDILFRST